MASSNDIWFVRVPDGKILRARSTQALRHYLKSARIPWDSRVRRSSEDPWQRLDHVEEFVDLVPKGDALGESSLYEPLPEPQQKTKVRVASELRALGMRGLVDELFNAFDSSFQKGKLTVAACTGLGVGVTLLLGSSALQMLPVDWRWAGAAALALVLLVLFSICTSILTRMTVLELSSLRAASLGEVRPGLVRNVMRLTIALALVGGLIVGLVVLLRLLPGWITPADPGDISPWLESLLSVIKGTRSLFEVLGWPILGLAMLLMGPILIVEEFSVAQGLGEWLRMLRQHLGRIYLYQALAFAFAAVLTLPLLVPVFLAFGYLGGPWRPLSIGESVPFHLLSGVALTPALAYLLVAHVFIYLNLRYEFFYSARER